jgi:DNA-binding LacI/PurR family transcriptional regulator
MSAVRQPRIVLLVDHLESDYPAQIVTGVLRAARLARARTWIVPGGWLARSPEEPFVRNFIYERVAAADVDGFVLSAGSLSNFCGLQRFRDWLAAFTKVPCVALGLDAGTVPSVFVNNESGLHAAVSHLIKQHGRRKIAFVGGPAASTEAAARLRGYRRALSEHDISSDENLIREGALGRESGMAATIELFDRRRLQNVLDAIVAVNDAVALGAMDELNRRGINVPGAMSVVGFDDSPGARAANPPLTTVNQQVEGQAYKATCVLLEAIESGSQAKSVELQSEAVIRSSCGCPLGFQNDSTAVSPVKVMLARTCRMALIERRAAITAELSRAAAGRMAGVSGWEARLLDSVVQDLATPGGLGFVREFELLARKHVAMGRNIFICHDLLSALRLQAIGCVSVEPSARPRLEDLFQEARLTLSRIGSDAERDRQESVALRFRILSKACSELLGSAKLSELAALLEEHLPALGIPAFSLSFLRGAPGRAALSIVARRVTGIWHGGGQSRSTTGLGLDPGLEQEETLVLEPLDFNGVPLGIAALSWGAQESVHYEILREMLSIAAFACHSTGKTL